MSKKLLIWDGDNTLWDGTLLEGDLVILPVAHAHLCKYLHDTGCLQAVASTNLISDVEQQLHKFGIDQYFLANQADLHRSKFEMVKQIMSDLNVVDPKSVLFLDDDPVNALGVATLGIDVCGTVDPESIMSLFHKRYITEEDRNRVAMYRSEIARKRATLAHDIDHIAFMTSCEMRAQIRLATEEDLPRILNLVERANQLSAAVAVYSEHDLRFFIGAKQLWVLLAEDKFGPYGLSGVARCTASGYLSLLTISCRLQGKGYGSAFLGWLLNKHGSIAAEWRETKYNGGVRALYEWYKFSIAITGEGICTAIHSTTSPVCLPTWICIT